MKYLIIKFLAFFCFYNIKSRRLLFMYSWLLLCVFTFPFSAIPMLLITKHNYFSTIWFVMFYAAFLPLITICVYMASWEDDTNRKPILKID